MSELVYEVPPCCDAFYTLNSPEIGMLAGALGAAMLGMGTLVSVLLERSGGRRRSS